MHTTNLIPLRDYSADEIDWQISAMTENAAQACEEGRMTEARRFVYRSCELQAEEAARWLTDQEILAGLLDMRDREAALDDWFRFWREDLIDESEIVIKPAGVALVTVGASGRTIALIHRSKRRHALAR